MIMMFVVLLVIPGINFMDDNNILLQPKALKFNMNLFKIKKNLSYRLRCYLFNLDVFCQAYIENYKHFKQKKSNICIDSIRSSSDTLF